LTPQRHAALPVPDRGINPPSGLLRRLAAALYDALLVTALFVIPTSLVMGFRGGDPVPPGDPVLQVLLLTTTATFFVWFWTHGGQTLGMRAWRLRVERHTGEPVDFGTGLLRFLVGIVSLAALGLGYAWVLVDSERRAWHDIAAGTRVVVLQKKPR